MENNETENKSISLLYDTAIPNDLHTVKIVQTTLFYQDPVKLQPLRKNQRSEAYNV